MKFIEDELEGLSGEEKLLAALIRSAIDDRDIEFLNSDKLDIVCELLHLDSDSVREKAFKELNIDKNHDFDVL